MSTFDPMIRARLQNEDVLVRVSQRGAEIAI
jgi:hypothetical protein